MKNILCILVTLALFSYILAFPAGDSNADASRTSEAVENAAKNVKNNDKEAAGKPNDSSNGKQQPGFGLMPMIQAEVQVPMKLISGFAEIGGQMIQGLTDGLMQG